jgi:hypothetical protein
VIDGEETAESAHSFETGKGDAGAKSPWVWIMPGFRRSNRVRLGGWQVQAESKANGQLRKRPTRSLHPISTQIQQLHFYIKNRAWLGNTRMVAAPAVEVTLDSPKARHGRGLPPKQRSGTAHVCPVPLYFSLVTKYRQGDLSPQLRFAPIPASRLRAASKFAVKADMAKLLRSTLIGEVEIQTPRVMAIMIGRRSTLMQVIELATWAIP